MRLRSVCALVLLAALGSAACGAFAVGREFPSPKLDSIKNGATTKADLERMFGPPTQVGLKDGDSTWTWYYFKKADPDLAKQLDVTFTSGGVVKSHTFSSSFPDDMKTMR
jgi:ABC-type glycerol-3-phosphate transport system substrate-binding protein